MCGITGYWAYAAAALSAPAFRGFTASMAHRGPDGSGIEDFPADRLWLGHRRLSILDLSERGRQPMSYANGRYWLTYNGEVFNYVELRATLKDLGHRFISESDSEVILAAYAEWGAACQTRLNGMWALAIWDARDKILFLSRDRFGIKPLHYMMRGGSIAFASELKAFLALPGIDGGFDSEVLAETLLNINGQESTSFTLLPEVRRLPGGHCLTLGADGTARIERWWDTLVHLPGIDGSLERQSEQFRELFFDACRLRLRSDVPIATSLSGGLDSSAIACALAELRRTGAVDHVPADWHRAFVACFPGTRIDEREYARQVIEHAGMNAHYEDIDDGAALASMEKIIFDLEGIYWVPLVGPWSIYRTMRNAGIRVSLDGHGADELLGGYHFFVERALDGVMSGNFSLARYLDLKRVLRGLVGGSADISRAGILGDLEHLAKRELQRLGLLGKSRAVYGRIQALKNRVLDRLSSSAGQQGATEAVPLPPLDSAYRPYTGTLRLYDENNDPRTGGMTALQGMLYTWFHGSVLPTILRSYDRASMAHGIEVRMPFMDWRLVTLGHALPDQSKIGGGFTKRVLRQAMKGLMPEDIRLRTNKIGFTSPLDEWSRGRLREWVQDTVASRAFAENPAWNGAAARAHAERAIAGKASINPVWPILNAHVLQQTFTSAARAAAKDSPPSPEK